MVFLPLIFLAACTGTSGDTDASLPPRLYPQPQTVELKAGQIIPATPKIIHPDSVANPQSFMVNPASLTNINIPSNRRQIPNERTTTPVDKSQLKTIPVGEGIQNFILLSSTGDTISTGVPIPAKGKVVKAIHSKPTKALPPASKDAAIAHLQYLNVEHGMTSSFVNATLEDQHGNIWLGSYIGVSVYNGESFTHFTENDGLSNNLVWSLLEDQNGHIWVGTQGGVSVFNGEHFTHYTENEGLSNNSVFSIIEDQSGNIWLGTDGGGVSLYNGESFTHYTEKEGLSNNVVLSMAEDQSGNIWLGTERGVSVFNGESFTHYTENEGLSHNSVRAMLEDKSGNIWLGTGGGLSLFNGEYFTHYTEKDGVSSDNVISILEDQSGNIWLGTGGGGVNVFNGDHFTQYSVNEGVSNNTVSSILEDKSGNIWVGTNGGGVSVFNGEGFTHYTDKEGLSHSVVLSVLEDQSGKIWAGTGGGGVSVFNGESFTHYTENEGLSNNVVWSILEDQRGNIWLGTGGGGVSVYNGESFTHYIENEGLSSNNVRVILEDQSGKIWLGTDGGGVSVYNGESFTHYTENEGLSNNIVWSILEDQSGNIWLGTEGGGVNVFNGESFTHYGINEGLSNNTVFSILEDKNGNIWLGTEGGGVSVFNGESFTHYTENEGVLNNSVWSIIEDKSAPLNEVAVFLGTENGLSRISLTEDEASGDKEFAFSIQNFGKQDGLKGLRFTTGAIIDSENRAWWSTGNGLVMLDLNTLTFSDKTPQPRLSQLEINEQFMDYRTILGSPDSDQDQITFSGVQQFENYPLGLKSPYEKNHLTFYFAAIDWAAPHKILYSYRMEVLNTNWSQPAADPVADYRNLPFGAYTFQIRAIGESGVWSEPFDYSFTILPPWWHTWWAYALYTIIFLNGLYLLRRYELNRFNLKNQLQIERVETDSLRKLDHLKSHFFTNISHEFRTPLTLIVGQIETLLDSESDRSRKKRLVSMNSNAEQLLSLINQLLDLSKLEAGKMELNSEETNIVSFLKNHFFSFESLARAENISLNFSSARATIMMSFDIDKMEKVFFNLFSNACKFTEQGGRIDVAVEIPQPDIVEIRVKDSGVGISKDRLPYIFDRFYQADPSNTRKYGGTGIGLSLAFELITIHNGTIEVNSEEGAGTEFVIRLPFEEENVTVGNKSSAPDPATTENVMAQSGLLDIDELLSEHDEIILIVEDNAEVRTFIREQLCEEYKILEAANGCEGITVSQGTIPDLIITDLMMPEMDGYEFSEKIRNDEKTSHIPIIMLTAKAGLDPRIEGLEAGIDAYLTKPFHVKELQTRVKTLIQQRKNLKKQFSTSTYFKPSVIAKSSVDQSFLRKAIEMIDKHILDEDFKVEDFAESLNMSVSQLNRKLKALVDQPAGTFIRSVRLQRAAELLNQTNKRVSEICFEVGFNDQAYFSRAFKKQYGKSPTAFRKVTI